MHDRRTGPSGWLTGLLLMLAGAGAQALQTLSVDHEQVRRWNQFAEVLLDMHQRQLGAHQVISTERDGGYAGRPDFYVEQRFVDAASGRLLSVVRWERRNPELLHSIEVYRYDDDGRLERDYLAAYLPVHRNAPIQTLVNLHHRDGGLRAFRQFDASGVPIYEQCRGQWQGREVMVSIEQDAMPAYTGKVPEDVDEALYANCFGPLPGDVDAHLAVLLARPQAPGDAASREAHEFHVDLLGGLITLDPDDATLYLDRGRRQFQLQAFDEAVADLSRAIELDPGLDRAWFWRGMARGRAGDVHGGIEDLGVYLQRHPDDAHAWTKRGVRHIWLGELEKARSDLERALELDPANAEAHDDLGVVLARQRAYDAAGQHFRQAIAHDPTYQKAHHNLAMLHHLAGEHAAALERVDRALALAPGSRNGLLLKAAILQALGRDEAALAVTEQAEFLPEGNWSERLPLQ